MKRIAKIICLLLLLCACATACFAGCTDKYPEEVFFETETFRCMMLKNKEEVYIIGLTEKAEKSAMLVFPETINSMPVTRIGVVSGTGKTVKYYTVDVSNAKKLYFLSPLDDKYKPQIKGIHKDCAMVVENGLPTLLLWHALPRTEFNQAETPATIYISKDDMKLYRETIEKKRYSENIKEANIYYHSNYEGAGICFVDAYDENGNYYVPYPTRSEYGFDNWYLDSECSQKWEGQSSFRNIEIHLYAKWVENESGTEVAQ